jgi:hypothetical protein
VFDVLTTVGPVHNSKAISAFLFGILALAFLAAGAAVPEFAVDITPLEALVVVPAATVCALASIALARRARWDFQRSLGRIGGERVAAAARFLGIMALLISLTAALAAGVFAVLALILG